MGESDQERHQKSTSGFHKHMQRHSYMQPAHIPTSMLKCIYTGINLYQKKKVLIIGLPTLEFSAQPMAVCNSMKITLKF